MTKHALIIGCGEYPAEGLPNLPGAEADARAVRDALSLPGIGSFDDIKLLPNPDLGQMQREIQALFDKAGKNDLVLLYYSGHGLKEPWGDDFYLACRDSETGDYLDSTAVPADFVRKRMNKSSAGKQVIILDCCFSGMFAENLPGHCELALLSSSGKLEYSRAAEELSPYTQLLVQALETGAAAIGEDKIATAGSLHEYLRKNLQAEGMKPEIHTRKTGQNLVIAHAPDPNIIPAGTRHDPLRAHYLQYLQETYRNHTLHGFAPRVGGRDVSLPLSELFLPLQAIEGSPALAEYAEQDLQQQAAGKKEKQRESELERTRRREKLEKRTARFAARQAAQRPLCMDKLLRRDRVILLGDPGSGKTTVTRYLTYALATGDYRHTGSGVKGMLPILVRIANYGKTFEQHSCDLLDYLADRAPPTPAFGPLLRRAVEEGGCLVILDGLDEVTEVSLRRQVTQRIQAMITAYPANRYFVTSRIVGYELSPLTREFTHATLSPLADSDRESFVRRWYTAIQAASGEEGKDGEEQAAQLIKALRNRPQIARMVANPLLLTLIVLMHRRGLPGRRAEIYATATDTLTEYWTASRGIELNAEEIKRILAPVAYYILSTSVGGVIARDDLVPRIEQSIRDQRGCDTAESRRLSLTLLQNLNQHSGIFLERGLDAKQQPVYGFLHQTFGEYLAALEISRQMLTGEYQLADHIHREAWHEPLLLAAGELALHHPTKASQLVREILDFSTLYEDVLHRNLLLAADCLAEDVDVAPAIRDEILRGLAELLNGEQPHEVQEAMLAVYRRLGLTHHAAAAVVALEPVYEEVVEKYRYHKKFIQILLYLGAKHLARPLLWPETEVTEHKGIDQLRFEYWPEQAMEYVLAYRQAALENSWCFQIDLEQLSRLPWSLLEQVLGKSGLQTLLQDLLAIESRQTDKKAVQRTAVLEWQLATLPEYPEPATLRKFLAPDQEPKLRRAAAQALLESTLHSEALDTLRQLATSETIPIERRAARAMLLEIGEDVEPNWTLLEQDALFRYGNDEALQRLLQAERLNVLLPTLLYTLTFSSNDIWDVLQDLLKYPATRDLGLAAMRWIALKPDSRRRLEACERLLENGQVETTIVLLQLLAYACPGQRSQRACRHLLLLRELASVLPLLTRDAGAENVNLRYQACLSLALVDIQADLSEENDLNMQREQVLAQHTELYRQATQELVSSTQVLLAQIQNRSPSWQALTCLSLYYLQGTPPNAAQAENDLRELAQNPLTLVHALLFALRCCHWEIIEQNKLALSQSLLTLPTVEARWTGIEILARLGDTQSIPVLIAALQDEEEAMRMTAAEALGLLGGEQAVPALIAALQDADEDVRSTAAESLGRLDGEQAIPALATALQDESEFVRRTAAYALGRLGNEHTVPVLTATLQDENWQVRNAAIDALGRIKGKQTVSVLVATLQDEHCEVRNTAAYTLGRIGGESAIPMLAATLQHENADVRCAAVEALGQIGGEEAIPILIAALQDKEPDVRYTVAYTLGRIGEIRAVPMLAAALQDKDADVRCSAATALGRIGEKPAVLMLTAALQDQAWYVRHAAAEALGWIEGEGEPVVSLLIATLEDQESDVRYDAAEILGRIVGERTVPLLTALLQDEDESVRSSATEVLGWIIGEQAMPMLTAALQDEDHSVRTAAIKALGRIGGEQAVLLLTAALQDQAGYTNCDAAKALGQIGGEPVAPQLIAVLQDDWECQRCAAAEALGQTGNEQAVPLLLALAMDWPNLSYPVPKRKNHEETQVAQSYARPLIALAPEAALAVLDTYARQFRPDTWPLRLRGHTLWQLDREAEALDYFTRAAQAENLALNHLVLAHWHFEHHDPDAAAQAAQRAWQRADRADDEETALCLLTRALLAQAQGDTAQATELYQQTRRREPYLARSVEELRYRHFWRAEALKIFANLKASNSF